MMNELEPTAYHEAGHAVMAWLTSEPKDPLVPIIANLSEYDVVAMPSSFGAAAVHDRRWPLKQ
jgi:hypothetical protein